VLTSALGGVARQGVVETERGLVVALPYGTTPDWLKNVTAAGSAELVFGRDVRGGRSRGGAGERNECARQPSRPVPPASLRGRSGATPDPSRHQGGLSPLLARVSRAIARET